MAVRPSHMFAHLPYSQPRPAPVSSPRHSSNRDAMVPTVERASHWHMGYRPGWAVAVLTAAAQSPEDLHCVAHAATLSHLRTPPVPHWHVLGMHPGL